jgi:hypothetical protein
MIRNPGFCDRAGSSAVDRVLCGATDTPFRGDRGAVSPSKGEGLNSYCEVREESDMKSPR